MPKMAEEEPNSGFSRERFVNAINTSKKKLDQKILDRQEREAKIDKASKPVANVANDEQNLKKSTRSGEQYSTPHVLSEGTNYMEDSLKKDTPITIPEMVSEISTNEIITINNIIETCSFVNFESYHQCHYCKREFKDVSSVEEELKMHMNSPIHNALIKCQFCERRFKDNKSYEKKLKSHMKTNHNMFSVKSENVIKCQFCERRFYDNKSYEKNLKSHMKNGHNTSSVKSENPTTVKFEDGNQEVTDIPEIVNKISTEYQFCEKGLKDDTSLQSLMEISHNTLRVKSVVGVDNIQDVYLVKSKELPETIDNKEPPLNIEVGNKDTSKNDNSELANEISESGSNISNLKSELREVIQDKHPQSHRTKHKSESKPVVEKNNDNNDKVLQFKKEVTNSRSELSVSETNNFMVGVRN